MADVRYAVKRGNKWLQGIEANEHYAPTGMAPTMGNRHTYSEYRTVWGDKPVFVERLTLASHIKILCEEYRWGDLKAVDFKVIARDGGADNVHLGV